MDLQLTFHEIESTEAIRAYVQKRAEKLPTFHEHILVCRVALEAPHRHKRHGRHFRVSIEMSIPGKQLAITRDPDDNVDHEDLYAAIDDAFEIAVRVLQDDSGMRRAKRARDAQSIRNAR